MIPTTLERWKKYSSALQQNESKMELKVASETSLHQGTVGAVIAFDELLVTMTSSGGSWMKQIGRVGHAAVRGASGALRRDVDSISFACSLSGNGEQIIDALLAQQLTENMFKFFDCELVSEGLLDLVPELEKKIYTAWIGLEVYRDGFGLYAAHTTMSFGYGFFTSSMAKPKSKISRLMKPELEGKVVQHESCSFGSYASTEDVLSPQLKPKK